MSKESPGIAWYALIWISSVLLLGGCAKPVGARAFLANEEVQKLIQTGVVIEITAPEYPESIDPIIQTNHGNVEDPIKIYKNGSPKSVVIAVSNYSDFDEKSIAWYITKNTGTGHERIPTPVIPSVYVVEAGVKPFADGGLYQLTVVVEKNNVPYNTYVFIKVI
jgi:hypothetical protein